MLEWVDVHSPRTQVNERITNVMYIFSVLKCVLTKIIFGWLALCDLSVVSGPVSCLRSSKFNLQHTISTA